MANEVLLLNADCSPLSFIPISSISWQEAVKFLYVNAVDVLHTYENWEVHSPSTVIKVPSVVMFKNQVKSVRKWIAKECGSPQKHLVFLRDVYICQYCNEVFPRSRLTIDHVIPKYHGGKTKWDNITTACESCNCRRGHNIKIQPRIKPFHPTYSQLIKNMRKFPISIPAESWNYYLGWDEDKIRIIDPKNIKIFNDNFDIGVRIELE
jgi:5-methylcytosine-specific restriction endonuclease McrA